MFFIVPSSFNILALLAAVIDKDNQILEIQHTDTSMHLRIPSRSRSNFILIMYERIFEWPRLNA